MQDHKYINIKVHTLQQKMINIYFFLLSRLRFLNKKVLKALKTKTKHVYSGVHVDGCNIIDLAGL